MDDTVKCGRCGVGSPQSAQADTLIERTTAVTELARKNWTCTERDYIAVKETTVKQNHPAISLMAGVIGVALQSGLKSTGHLGIRHDPFLLGPIGE